MFGTSALWIFNMLINRIGVIVLSLQKEIPQGNPA